MVAASGTKSHRLLETQAPIAPDLLGTCMVYLGGLNYFFSTNEKYPIVSRIGIVIGQLHVAIAPLVAPTWANGTRDITLFEPYRPPQVDLGEEQVLDYMDRTIAYHVILHKITDLEARKHSQLSLVYGFYQEPSRESDPIPISGRRDIRLNNESHYMVDVTEPLVKYLTGNDLVIELYGSNG